MIYLDVTSLRTWSRPPVGVIRTNLECARWLIHNVPRSVGFCYFDVESKSFVRVDPHDVQGLIARLDSCSQPEVARPPLAASQVRRLNRLAQMTKAMLPPYLFSVARAAYINLTKAAADSASPRGETTKRSSAGENLASQGLRDNHVTFTEKDVYVSVGLDWDIGQLPYVRQLKEQSRFKVALMCYDVVPVKYPHLCLDHVAQVFPKYLMDLASAADHVFCDSASTQRDLRNVLRQLGSPTPHTSVIRLGARIPSAARSPPAELPSKLHHGAFILYVSTVERRKNHEILYKAYVKLRETGVSNLPTMVFVGMRGWGSAELLNDIALDPRVQGDFLILKGVSDPSLGWLYQNCIFTVFPSLYEGWGLPVAESLAFGKFCIASNRGALPEVGGPLVEYLDPWDAGGWANALQKYSSESQELAEREAQIRSHFVAPTWDRFGQGVFREVSTLIPQPQIQESDAAIATHDATPTSRAGAGGTGAKRC